MKTRITYITSVMAAMLLLASCGSSRKAASTRPSDKQIVIRERHKPHSHNGDPGFDVNSSVAEQIVKSARKWLGTPYRYGGKDRKGTDCSGMTMSLFSEVAGVALPRNSGAQYEYCVSIGHEDLQPGDLVFFCGKSGGPVNHVGLYVGDRRMIHASSSRGVVESSLDERYWLTHYYGSGRVNAVTYAMTGRKPSRKRGKKKELPTEPVRVVPQSEEFAEADNAPAATQAPQVPEPVVAATDDSATIAEAPEAGIPDISEPTSASTPTAEEISDEVKAAFGF